MEVGKVYSGVEFNKLSEGTKYYKLTSKTEIHNGFQFKYGLNIDTLPFKPTGECSPGGLYFTELKYFSSWLGSHFYFRMVTIPDDAQVYVENIKFKTNKFILGPRKEIFSEELDLEIVEILCKENRIEFARFLESEKKKVKFYSNYVDKYQDVKSIPEKYQTEEMWISAVSRSHENLKDVKYQTKKIRSAALSCDLKAIHLLKFSSNENDKTKIFKLEKKDGKLQISGEMI